jgi:hypothetical protein
MSEPLPDVNQRTDAGEIADSELQRLLGRCADLRENSARLAGELDSLTRQVEQQLTERDKTPTPEQILSKQPRAD